jgi:hypothetical protein
MAGRRSILAAKALMIFPIDITAVALQSSNYSMYVDPFGRVMAEIRALSQLSIYS